MSNTWLNVRFGEWHLQILQMRDWRWSDRHRIVRVSHNAYQAEMRANDSSWRWFALYECRWPW